MAGIIQGLVNVIRGGGDKDGHNQEQQEKGSKDGAPPSTAASGTSAEGSLAGAPSKAEPSLPVSSRSPQEAPKGEGAAQGEGASDRMTDSILEKMSQEGAQGKQEAAASLTEAIAQTTHLAAVADPQGTQGSGDGHAASIQKKAQESAGRVEEKLDQAASALAQVSGTEGGKAEVNKTGQGASAHAEAKGLVKEAVRTAKDASEEALKDALTSLTLVEKRIESAAGQVKSTEGAQEVSSGSTEAISKEGPAGEKQRNASAPGHEQMQEEGWQTVESGPPRVSLKEQEEGTEQQRSKPAVLGLDEPTDVATTPVNFGVKGTFADVVGKVLDSRGA